MPSYVETFSSLLDRLTTEGASGWRIGAASLCAGLAGAVLLGMAG
jgi:hypothetical protein